jgi:hypothetical protein
MRWPGGGAHVLVTGNDAPDVVVPLVRVVARGEITRPEGLTSLRREYEQKVERDSAALDELHLEKQQLHAEELPRTRQNTSASGEALKKNL